MQSFLQKDILRPKAKLLNIFKCSTKLLFTDFKFGKGFTHQFQVSILSKNLVPAKEYISNKLCDFNTPYLLDDGLKFNLKLDTG